MSPLLTSLVAFAIIFAGAFLGMFMRQRLPAHHLSGDTKDVVRLGTGLIATIAALVLSLLISSASNTYQTQNTEVEQLTANVVLLDRTLALYGSETDILRIVLRKGVTTLANRIWHENGSETRKVEPFVESTDAEMLYRDILKLSPQDETQRLLQSRAIEALTDIGKTRLLIFAQSSGSIPIPFLVVLVFWLTMIFVSFSLFADINATTIAALCVFALSASGALFLILELSQPFTGLMRIPSDSLRHALTPLGS
ncbi:MAG: DUF4239 domain-containing protein [Candidatus Acidiferrum sp.]